MGTDAQLLGCLHRALSPGVLYTAADHQKRDPGTVCPNNIACHSMQRRLSEHCANRSLLLDLDASQEFAGVLHGGLVCSMVCSRAQRARRAHLRVRIEGQAVDGGGEVHERFQRQHRCRQHGLPAAQIQSLLPTHTTAHPHLSMVYSYTSCPCSAPLPCPGARQHSRWFS